MPHRLKQRKEKIQAKRKQTPWREFVMEFGSWFNLMVHKTPSGIGRYPENGRYKNTLSSDMFVEAPLMALDIDSESNFFDQLTSLLIEAPKLENLSFGENVNSLYTESIFGAKNAYLCIEVGLGCENTLYSSMVYYNCTNVIGSLQVTNGCNNIYNSKSITKSYNIFYSRYIQGSANIWFSSNCIGCEECVGCDGLTNQKYAIHNVVYDKDEYLEKKKVLLRQLLRDDTVEYSKISNIGAIINSPDCTGSGVYVCSDVTNGYNISRINTGRNVLFGDGGDASSRYYDAFHVGDNCDDFYGVSCCGINNTGIYCSVRVIESTNIFYSYHMDSCSYCLGCTGLKNKSFCIFNKQYTKEERYDKVDEIFSQMEKDGTLGTFLPGSLNPFCFNDTAAYLVDDSFTKEEVEAKGYLRRDKPITVDIPEGVQTVKVSELEEYEGWETSDGKLRDPDLHQGDDKVGTIDSEIMKKVIVDEEGNVYRIVPMEYEFLIKYGLPLPRKHWLQRIKQHFILGFVSDVG